MTGISSTLKRVYNAEAVVIVPGSGTYGMEAVARQFATNKNCLVIRNGWFSYRWTEIFEMGDIPSSSTVLKACPVEAGSQAAFAPAPAEEVVQTIQAEKPDMVFAPHVETSSGILLPDDYQTFRLGLFGLDKLHNIERTVATLEKALDQIILPPCP